MNVPVSIALSAPVNDIFTAMTVTDHAGNTNTYSFNGGSDTYGLSTAEKAPAATHQVSCLRARGSPLASRMWPAGRRLIRPPSPTPKG